MGSLSFKYQGDTVACGALIGSPKVSPLSPATHALHCRKNLVLVEEQEINHQRKCYFYKKYISKITIGFHKYGITVVDDDQLVKLNEQVRVLEFSVRVLSEVFRSTQVLT